MSKQFHTPRILRILRDLFVEPGRPLDCVQVEVSSRCFGRCSYCPHTVLGKEWHGRDMELKTFQRLRPLMRRAVRVHLQGWGEPLLNPAFFTMAALARRAGCAVSTTTSGLGLTERLAAAAAILAETAATSRNIGIFFYYNLPNWGSGGSGCHENIDRTLFVTAHGEITPCVFRSIAPGASAGQVLTFGNVNTMEPLAIWDNPGYHAFRLALRSDTPDAVCRVCPKHFIG